MFKLRILRGLGMPELARLAAIGLIFAACVTHYKPSADSAAHALGPAGHAAPPGLTRVIFVPQGPERN